MDNLTNLQKTTLNLFKTSPLKEKFYWTGGTALSAIYLNHRKSNDLDFFTNQTFTYKELLGFIDELKRITRLTKTDDKKIYDRWEFFLHNKAKLRIEFVRYDSPAFKKRKKWQGVYVDSLDDIACNKTMALFDRNDPKDLFDLYFLLTKAGYKAQKLLKMVEKKFGVKLEESSFWSETYKALEDIKTLIPLLPQKTKKAKQKLLKEVENYFINQSTKHLRTILK